MLLCMSVYSLCQRIAANLILSNLGIFGMLRTDYPQPFTICS